MSSEVCVSSWFSRNLVFPENRMASLVPQGRCKRRQTWISVRAQRSSEIHPRDGRVHQRVADRFQGTLSEGRGLQDRLPGLRWVQAAGPLGLSWVSQEHRPPALGSGTRGGGLQRAGLWCNRAGTEASSHHRAAGALASGPQLSHVQGGVASSLAGRQAHEEGSSDRRHRAPAAAGLHWAPKTVTSFSIPGTAGATGCR